MGNPSSSKQSFCCSHGTGIGCSQAAEAKRIWDRFEFIYAPKHGSWLNMAEIELNVLSKQVLL